MAIAIPKHQIHQRLLGIDLPRDVKQNWLKLVYNWIEQSGEEWTANRIKAIKQDIINSASVDSYVLKSEWIAKKNPYTFKGIIGSLQRISQRSTKGLKEVLALVNMHTILMADSLTEQQLDKFVKAVSTTSRPTPKKYIDTMKGAARDWQVKLPIYPAETILKRAEGKKSHEQRMYNEILTYFSTAKGRQILTDFCDLTGEALLDALPSRRKIGCKDETIGTICVTQNPGYKARFYAAPHIWIQHVMEPLGRRIYARVESLPWDCTFNQTKGFKYIQDALKRGCKTFCFDLSSATDRFPLDIQVAALRKVFPHKTAQRHINLFAWFSRQPWKLLNNDQQIVWKKGQPLGMYPSFATFTLSHGLILYGLNGNKHDDMFFVLGDDVIILDEQLADKYRQFLIDCDIDYNPDKSIVSDRFGEFAGRIILPDSVIPSRKWSRVRDDSLVSFLTNWGPRYTHMVPKDMKPLFDKWASLPEPYGLGFNPKGLSLDERLSGIEEYLVKEDESLEYLVNYRSLNMSRIAYADSYYYFRDTARILNVSDTIEQTVLRTFEQILPLVKKDLKLCGKNVYDIQPGLKLPLTRRSQPVSKNTLSSILERFRKFIPQ